MAPSTRSHTRQLALCGLEIPATTFRLNRLCPELRQSIWEFTLPYRQVHHVGLRNDRTRNFLQIQSPPLPVTFQVSHESRLTARRCLERFDRHTRPMTDGSPRSYGYFNPRTDFLHIPDIRGYEIDVFDLPEDLLLGLPRVRFPNLLICGHKFNIIDDRLQLAWSIMAVEALSSLPLPSQAFFAEMAIIGGFRGHASCQKCLPVGDPTVTDRPYADESTVYDLLCGPRHCVDCYDGIFPIRHVVMPLACDCPGVAEEAMKKLEKKARKAASRRA